MTLLDQWQYNSGAEIKYDSAWTTQIVAAAVSRSSSEKVNEHATSYQHLAHCGSWEQLWYYTYLNHPSWCPPRVECHAPKHATISLAHV